MEIREKHFFLTGGVRRVGGAITAHLLERGARVTAHHHTSPLDGLERKWGDRVRGVRGDLMDPATWKGIAESVGPLDGFIHCASQYAPTPVDSVSRADWERFHRIHGECAFFLAQALRPQIRKGGAVIFIGDVNGERPLKRYTAYAASKAEVLFLTRQLAKEWAPDVRVNSVSPGAVLLPENYTDAQKRASVERSLFKRVGSPEDVAFGVEFLIRNDYVTGFNLRVDGGRSLVEY